MSLQFVMGGAGSGKTRYLYETAIKQAVEQPDRLFLFVVPEQYTMQTQKELVRLHPRKGLMNMDVLSFKRLAYRYLRIWECRFRLCWMIWENPWYSER